MFKVNKKRLLKVLLGGVCVLLTASVASIFIISCSQTSPTTPSNPPPSGGDNNQTPTPIPPSSEQVPNFSFQSSSSEQNAGAFNQIGILYEEELGSSPRVKNNNYYQTSALTQYQQAYGFKYPAWNYNYELTNPQTKKPNWEFSNGTNTIDGRQICFDEVVSGQNVKYNNPDWILSEISKNQLKKHPASDGIYQQKIDNIQATTKRFVVNTAMNGTIMLGLFAPAGEVVTLTFSDKTFDLISKNNYNGLEIVINDNFWDNKSSGDNGDSGGISNRYPFIKTTFKVDPTKKEIKFGSPFGGGIAIKINTSLLVSPDGSPFNKQCQDIDFTVSGAVKTMLYNDAVTTAENWNNQIKQATSQQLAPLIQANANYFSLSLPITETNKVGTLDVNKLAYPKNLFDKWNEFFFLSNYYAGRDIAQIRQKIDLQFCDDLWSSLNSYGGSNVVCAPVNLGAQAFFSSTTSTDAFNSKQSFDLFNAINQNFLQDLALFKTKGVNNANQVSLFNLAILNDVGRFRNEYNLTGEQTNDGLSGWGYIENPYVTINELITNNVLNSNDESPLLAILVYTLGPKNYVDYVRSDAINRPNNKPNWNGFDEIVDLSNTFKINFWPAFKDFGRIWRDSWPIGNEPTTSNQNSAITYLENNFPAMDFVANLYATGSYLYDLSTNEYVYTGDTSAPIDIVAGRTHVLDLDKFTVSTNQAFNWTSVKFNPKTKNGGQLELDPNNPKKLIYTPPSNKNTNDVTKIDEFDIELVPGQWENKPTKYVPGYKFKIKMRQVINQPILEVFDVSTYPEKPDKLLSNIKNLQNDPLHTQPLAFFDTKIFTNKPKEAARIKFKYIIPENGNYILQNTWNDYFNLVINGNDWYTSHQPQDKFTQTWQKTCEKGDIIDIEFDLLNLQDFGNIDAKLLFAPTDSSPHEEIDLFKQTLLPDFDTYTTLSPLDAVNSKQFQYKDRTVDYNLYNRSLVDYLNLSSYQFSTIDPKKYTINYDGKNLDQLNNYNNTNYFEVVSNQSKSITIDINFVEPTMVSSLLLGHRIDNPQARPTHIKVTDISYSNGNTNNLYDGVYGEEFNDRDKDYAVINFTKSATVKKLRIEMVGNENPFKGFSFKWLRLAPTKFYPISTSFAINNDKIKLTSGWRFQENNKSNLSELNNVSLVSTSANSAIKFKLNNANGFSLIGQKSQTGANFNVYINGWKVNPTVIDTTSPNTQLTNQVIYSYFIDDEADLKKPLEVVIVHTDNNPLYLDYVLAFGKNVAYLS